MKKTLVLGASLNKQRYAFMAISRLTSMDFWVIGIGSKEGIINNCHIHTSQVPIDDLHTVSIYLNARNQEEYYDYIVNMKPKRLIFNPGAENIQFEVLLAKHQIKFERACTLVLLSMGQF
jgi:predicted CoA-binding protein